MFETEALIYALLFAVALVISIGVHEAAHAYVAVWQGDDTPKLAGRATLNPIPHIAPMGLIVPIVMVLMKVPILFGWGKPVTVVPAKMKNPKWSHVMVSLAGPFSNVVLCLLTIIVTTLLEKYAPALTEAGSLAAEFSAVMIYLNAILAVFNLLPMPPLDGAALLEAILPRRGLEFFQDYVAPYGMFIFIALMISGKINFIFRGAFSLVDMLQKALSGMIG